MLEHTEQSRRERKYTEYVTALRAKPNCVDIMWITRKKKENQLTAECV